jgi:hypothetical protein
MNDTFGIEDGYKTPMGFLGCLATPIPRVAHLRRATLGYPIELLYLPLGLLIDCSIVLAG